MYEPHMDWGNDGIKQNSPSINLNLITPPTVGLQSGVVPILSGYRLPCSGKDFLFPNQPLASGSNIVYNYSFEHFKFGLAFGQDSTMYNSGIYINENRPVSVTGWPTTELLKLCPLIASGDATLNGLQGKDFNNKNFISPVAPSSSVYYGKYALQFSSFRNYNIYSQEFEISGLPVAVYTRQYKPYNENLDIEYIIYHHKPVLQDASYNFNLLPLRLTVSYSGDIIFECSYREYFENYINSKNNGIIDYDINFSNKIGNVIPFNMVKKTIPGYLYYDMIGTVCPQQLKLEDDNRILQINNLKIYNMYANRRGTNVGELGYKLEAFHNMEIIPFNINIPIIIPSSYFIRRIDDRIYDNYIFDVFTLVNRTVVNFTPREQEVFDDLKIIDKSQGECLSYIYVSQYANSEFIPRSGVIDVQFRYLGLGGLNSPPNYIAIFGDDSFQSFNYIVLQGQAYNFNQNSFFEDGVVPKQWVGFEYPYNFLYYPINSLYIYPPAAIPSGNNNVPVWIGPPIEQSGGNLNIDSFNNLSMDYVGQTFFNYFPFRNSNISNFLSSSVETTVKTKTIQVGLGHYIDGIWSSPTFGQSIPGCGPTTGYAACAYNGCVTWVVDSVIDLEVSDGFTTDIQNYGNYSNFLDDKYYFVYSKDANITWI